MKGKLFQQLNSILITSSLVLVHFLVQALASHGPEGGDVLSIATDPNSAGTIYVGTSNGGIFKSTDSGGNWVFRGLSDFSSVDITIDPINKGVLYVCCIAEGGIFKSTDGGDSWTPLGFIAGRLAIDPRNPQTIYGISSGRVVRSRDGGTNWESIGLEGQSPSVIVIDPITPKTVYVGTEGRGIYKSENEGEKWIQYDVSTPTNPTILSLAINSENPRFLFAGTYEGLFKSKDGGESWRSIPTGFSVFRLVIDPSYTPILYAVTPGDVPFRGVYKSSDSGESWVPIWLEGPTPISIAINPIETGTLYVGTFGLGIFKSTNGGMSWKSGNRGLVATQINSVIVARSDTSRVYTGLFRAWSKSVDGGVSWIPPRFSPSLVIRPLAIDPNDANTVYGGGGSIIKSTDGGDSWVVILKVTSADSVAIDPNDPNIVYAGATVCCVQGEVHKSTNAGEDWTRVALLPDIVFSLVIDPQNTNVLYAGLRLRGVYKSQEGGLSWSPSGLSGVTVWSITIDWEGAIYTGSGPIYKSTDGGESWTPLPQGATTVVVDPNNPNTLYAGNLNGVYKSTDGGETWVEKNNGLTNTRITQLAIASDTGRLYAATGGAGVWFSDDGAETWE